MRIAASSLAFASQHLFAASSQRRNGIAGLSASPITPVAKVAANPAKTDGTPTVERQTGDAAFAGFAGLIDRIAALANRVTPAPANETETPQNDAAASDDGAAKGSSKLMEVLGKMFGVKGLRAVALDVAYQQVSVRSGQEQQSTTSDASGSSYDYHSDYQAYEATSFTAKGVVESADGRRFTLNFSYSREQLYQQSTDVSVRTNAPASATGPAAASGNRDFGFTAQPLAITAPTNDLPPANGSAKLSTIRTGIDRNRDGRIDRQDELAANNPTFTAALALLAKFRNAFLPGGSLAVPVSPTQSAKPDAAYAAANSAAATPAQVDQTA